MKFRKRPVTIEAFQWFPGTIFPKGFEALHSQAFMDGPNGTIESTDNRRLLIQTLEGRHAATPGDWIIKGVAGEFYPCKPDIFARTYEPAEPHIEEKL